MNIEVAVQNPCLLGEGPIWDMEENILYFLDIISQKVHSYNPTNFQFLTYFFDIKITTIAKKKDNSWIGASNRGFVNIDIKSQKYNIISNPESHLINNRFNDGKLDSKGRVWAGTMDDIKGELGVGKLYRLDLDGNVNIMIDNVTCSNGLAWSLDLKTFYFIDSLEYNVVAYDFEENSGEITNPRVVLSFPKSEGLPDGMCIDENGFLWVAIWGGWKVVKCNPNTGEIIQEIKLPVSQVTSCAFNSDYSELYITSASVGLNKEQLEKEPLAGSLFKVIL